MVDVDFTLVYLHDVEEGCIIDVSEQHSASLIRIYDGGSILRNVGITGHVCTV